MRLAMTACFSLSPPSAHASARGAARRDCVAPCPDAAPHLKRLAEGGLAQLLGPQAEELGAVANVGQAREQLRSDGQAGRQCVQNGISVSLERAERAIEGRRQPLNHP